METDKDLYKLDIKLTDKEKEKAKRIIDIVKKELENLFK